MHGEARGGQGGPPQAGEGGEGHQRGQGAPEVTIVETLLANQQLLSLVDSLAAVS